MRPPRSVSYGNRRHASFNTQWDIPETSRAAGSTQFYHGNHLQGPLPTLLRDGYIGTFDVTSGTGWHQVTADAHVARTEFRKLDRSINEADFRWTAVTGVVA